MQTREYGFNAIGEAGMVKLTVENLKRVMDPVLVRRHAALWRTA